ncbi:MAG: 3-hydroxyacyl-CoA dehydrogenase family protein [Cyclobacteriaceae bacterium]|nr:3-hydroxyacyl-CoA dehydrogenase family protein [Cyclobacteriaceae bacterium]
MNVLIIGNPESEERFIKKFGETHQIERCESLEDEFDFNPDIVFWFNMEENKEYLTDLDELECPIFVNIPFYTLKELVSVYGPVRNLIIGFCGISSLFEREILEVSLLSKEQNAEAISILEELGSQFEIVEDRIGMVTPRTLFMIINEAYFSLMEGVASKEDIDKSMKLGTNYPYGPFEWADMIGINHIYETLEAIHYHTGDPRYRVCEWLKNEYLNNFIEQHE